MFFVERGNLIHIRGYDDIGQYTGSTENLAKRIEGYHQQMLRDNNLSEKRAKAPANVPGSLSGATTLSIQPDLRFSNGSPECPSNHMAMDPSCIVE